MPLVWSRQSPDYLAFLAEKQGEKERRYTHTAQKHHLAISDSIIREQARLYAEHEADAHFQVFTDIFKPENVVKFIGGLVNLIFEVAISPFMPHIGGLAIAQQVIGITTSLSQFGISVATSVLDTMKMDTEAFFGATTASLQKATTMLRGLNEQAPNLAQVLIHQPYAIFPEGAIYKGENPGTLGYKAGLEGYNPMKGINGVYQENMQAEQINTRAHRHMAGNANYTPLKLPFPKAEFKEDAERVKETYRHNLENRLEEIKRGFAQLTQDYFGAFDTSATQRLFNEHMRKFIHPQIKRLNSYDFLDKMTYYRKGERLPIFEHIAYPDDLKLPQSEWARYFTRITLRDSQDYSVLRSSWNTAGGGSTWSETKTKYRTWVFDHRGVIVESYSEEEVENDSYFGGGGTTHLKEDLHKKGQRIILRRVLKQGKTLPTKSADALRYKAIEGVEPPPVDLQTEYALRDAYHAYLKAYWDCFEIVVLGSTEEARPLEYAKSFTRNHYGRSVQRYAAYDLGNIFFDTGVKPLNVAEQRAQDMFNDFVQYYRLKQSEGV